jgi:transposase
MVRWSEQVKATILREYVPYSRSHSFAALARRHNIKGGKSTIQKWYTRWKKSASGLKRKVGSARPRLLSAEQIRDYIELPIRNRNRAHLAIHYPDLLANVREKTGVNVSLSTIQRYGKKILGNRDQSTRARTAAECTCNHISTIIITFLVIKY